MNCVYWCTERLFGLFFEDDDQGTSCLAVRTPKPAMNWAQGTSKCQQYVFTTKPVPDLVRYTIAGLGESSDRYAPACGPILNIVAQLQAVAQKLMCEQATEHQDVASLLLGERHWQALHCFLKILVHISAATQQELL